MNHKHKVLSYLMILLTLLTTSVYADTINSISGPDTITQGEEVTLNVDYEANQERVLAVYLKTTTGVKKNYYYKRFTVAAGAEIKQFTFNVPANAPTNETYKYGTYIAPVGKYFKDNLSKAYQQNVQVESDGVAEDNVNSIAGPATINHGEEVTLYVDYVASEERDLVAYLKTTTGEKKNYYYKRSRVYAGDKIKQFTFNVPANAPTNETYKYGTYIAPIGKYWKYNLGKAYQYNVHVVSDLFKTVKTQYSPDDKVEVMVNVPLSGDQDWVGIYPVGASNDWANVVAWNWVGQGTTLLSLDQKPMPAGEYEARLFYNNSFVLEASTNFTVLDKGYADLGIYEPERFPQEGLMGDAYREYVVYRPKNTFSTTMPVVLFIEGGGNGSVDRYSGMMKFLASKGYYVIGSDTGASYNSELAVDAFKKELDRVNLTASKLVVIGHSLGGGQAFYVMKNLKDQANQTYGSDASRVISVDGWFSFNMDKEDLNTLNTQVSFLQMNGIDGTGTDPRVHLKIWELSTTASKSFYTLPSLEHGYIGGDLDNILGKDDLRLTIGALIDDTFNNSNEGDNTIPESSKASYQDIYGALEGKDTYTADCAGVQYNAIAVIENNDIDYCTLGNDRSGYPVTKPVTRRFTDNDVIRPSVGNPFLDNVYDTKIKMINKPDDRISSYPKIQSWNKDMTLLRVSNRLYNADTLEESVLTKGLDNDAAYAKLCSRNGSDFRWSNKDANKFYVLRNDKNFIEGKITANDITCNTVLEDFSMYETIEMSSGESNIDNNDQYVVFIAKKYNDVNIYMILFDIQNTRIVWEDKKVDNASWGDSRGYWFPEVLDWVSVSQSGKYIIILNHQVGFHSLARYDINLTNKVTLEFIDRLGNRVSIGEHGDFGFDVNGNEVFVQNVSGQGDGINGIYMFNLDQPHELAKRILEGSYGGGHVSGRNVDRPGWCYVTKQYEGYKDVFALKLDGSSPDTVQYFSQTHLKDNFDYGNNNIGIYLETYGSPSPDGTQMIFNSHWGNADQSDIDTFVVEAQ